MKMLTSSAWATITRAFSVAAFAAVTCANSTAFAANSKPQPTGQASITLTNDDAAYCYSHEVLWTLTKTPVLPDGVTQPVPAGTTVGWKIEAVKDSVSGATKFVVHGGLTITNTGTAPATIGNIVINLQKPNGQKISGKNVPWVSLAADIANAVAGEAATTANVVAAGTAESQPFNAAFGAANYVVSGDKGTFTETAGSGFLEFTDASNNTLFSLVPQPVIPVGGSITLLYHATFQTSVIAALPAGTPLRVEALVTFGNAGDRGGGGATASNIDINGDGVIDNSAANPPSAGEQGANDADEANVRTVPSRVTLPGLPAAPTQCNDTVTLADLEGDLSPSGTVVTSNATGFGSLDISASSTTNVSVDIVSGEGAICNTATLKGSDGGTLDVIVRYDPNPDPTLPPIPVYATYTCCEVSLSATSCVDVGSSELPPFNPGDFCSYTQGGYGQVVPAGPNAGQPSGAPALLLWNNFASVYPSGVEVGILGAGGFSMKFTSPAAIGAYLPSGGTAAALNADLTNPTSTSSGVFGGQVLTLQINVDLSNALLNPAGFGGLVLHGTNTSLDGQTIAQILAIANTALGGGALPSDYSISDLNNLVDLLNNAFDNCTPSTWAQTHLAKP